MTTHAIDWRAAMAAMGLGCEYASAVLGILGTALMSRRFAPQVLRSLVYAASWPILWVFGHGQRARRFFIAKAKINWDNPDSPADMTLGLNLLFWAFFVQLLSLFLKQAAGGPA
jgi:hypothetical protein